VKQYVFVVMLVVAAAGFIVTPLPAQELKGPQLVIKEMTHDFGKVVEGAKLQHVFEVGNSGDAALEIQRIQPT
jgi:hypothetical protein